MGPLSLLVQVQGVAAERRNANIHLLRCVPDVARRSRWAHLAGIKDLHLADLIRQAEKHHRDRKTAHLPEDDSSGARCALCQEYNRAPRACTSPETYTPIMTCRHDEVIHNRIPRFPKAIICDLVSDIVSVPRSASVSVEHQHQTTTSNHEELARTTYT